MVIRLLLRIKFFSMLFLCPDQHEEEEEKENWGLVWIMRFRTMNRFEHHRSKLDEECDEWFSKLLGTENGILGDLAQDARKILTTPVELKNDQQLPLEDPEWTPYVTTRLPWTPLVPAYGLEEYGLLIPRRIAETWRHFDVPGMVSMDYSGSTCSEQLSKEDQVENYKTTLYKNGAWLDNEDCTHDLFILMVTFVQNFPKPPTVITILTVWMDLTKKVVNIWHA